MRLSPLAVVASLLFGCASTTATTAATTPGQVQAQAPAAALQTAPVETNQVSDPPAKALSQAASDGALTEASAPSTESPKEDLAGLRAQVRARRAELTQCYAKTSAARSGRNGCVPVHFTLASDGRMKVSSAPKYSASDLRSRMNSAQCGSNPRLVDPSLEACVAKVFARIKVDQPRSTESVEGIYPVYFASK